MENKPSLVVLVAILLFSIGAIGTVVLPFFDKEINQATASGEARHYKVDSSEARGRQVYIKYGCQTCHTQLVRSVAADINQNLGPATAGGDYRYDLPHLMGSNRTGPDLMWVGTRYNEMWQRQHLIDPQSTSPGSIMPKFDYIPNNEMDDLIKYLMSLKPAEAKTK